MREVMAMIRRAIAEGRKAAKARGITHCLKTVKKEDSRFRSGWRGEIVLVRDHNSRTFSHVTGTTYRGPSEECFAGSIRINYRDRSDSIVVRANARSDGGGHSVNLLVAELADPECIDKLAAVLATCGIPFALPALVRS